MSHMKKKQKKNNKYCIRRNVIFDEVVLDEMSCTDLDISDSFKNSTLKLNNILN